MKTKIAFNIPALVLLLSPLNFAQTLSFTFTTIDYPGAAFTFAAGINNSARIVGAYNLNTPEEGHLLEGAHGFSDSGGAFTTIDFPSATTTTPHKINDSGQIVGV